MVLRTRYAETERTVLFEKFLLKLLTFVSVTWVVCRLARSSSLRAPLVLSLLLIGNGWAKIALPVKPYSFILTSFYLCEPQIPDN